MNLLDPEELRRLAPAETHAYPGPIPTQSGRAAAFVAMNDVYGRRFDVSFAEARTPDMARERAAALSQKQYGFKLLGAADGPGNNAILGENNAWLYRSDRRAALDGDRIAAARLAHEQSGPARGNRRSGYVLRG